MLHMFPESLFAANLATILTSLCLLWFSYGIVYNLFLSPLSRFPGSKAWAISRIPSQLALVRGRMHLDILELHKKHGPVVRIGPNELAFTSAQAFRDIYGYRQGGKLPLSKDPTRYISPVNGVPHVVAAIDDAVHARQRKVLSYAFSDRARREQEPLIRRYVDHLVEILANSGEKEVDIKRLFTCFSFDVTGDLMCGESFGSLRAGGILDPWIQVTFVAVRAVAIVNAISRFPWLRFLMKVAVPKRLHDKRVEHFMVPAHKVDKRLESGSGRPDFMSALLKNGLRTEDSDSESREKNLSRSELHSNAFTIIIAGSEAVATTLSGCIFHLCKNPRVMDKIVSEIRSAFPDPATISSSSAAKLPYLNAVIEETLRVYPSTIVGPSRVTPAEGAHISGHWIPGNTLVACHYYASSHSSSNFNAPEEFLPERWIGENKTDCRDAMQAFSLGPRNCVGKLLALDEIKLTLSCLLLRFDITLCPESDNWIKQKAYLMYEKPALMVRCRNRLLDYKEQAKSFDS